MLTTQTEEETIPNIIWSYIEDTEDDNSIDMFELIHSWKKENHDYQINILNSKILHNYINPEEFEGVTGKEFSFVLRLKLLDRYGGIWLNPTIVLKKPIDWVKDLGPCVLFTQSLRSPENSSILSWFIAAHKGHKFIKEWLKEVYVLIENSYVDDYPTPENPENPEKKRKIYFESSLVTVAARKVYIKNDSGVYLYDASDFIVSEGNIYQVTSTQPIVKLLLRTRRHNKQSLLQRAMIFEPKENLKLNLPHLGVCQSLCKTCEEDSECAECFPGHYQADGSCRPCPDQDKKDKCDCTKQEDIDSLHCHCVTKEVNLKRLGLVDIVLINLLIKRERLISMQKRFDGYNLPFTRFNAISGRQIRDSFINPHISYKLHPRSKMNLDTVNEFLNRSEHTWSTIGCWQSHLGVLLEIIDKAETREDGPVFIFEDDVLLSRNFLEKLKWFMQEVPDDWDVLFIHHSYTNGLLVKPNILRIYFAVAAGSYIVRNSTVAKKLVEYANNEYFTIADRYWNILFDSGELVAYGILPVISCQHMALYQSDTMTQDRIG